MPFVFSPFKTMNLSANKKPLDFNELLNRCLGEVEFAQKILRDFLQTTRPLLDEIGNALMDYSENQAAFKVHRLKGTAGLVAANPLLETLVELENMLRRAAEIPQSQLSVCLDRSYRRFDEVQRFAEMHLLDPSRMEPLS